MKGWCEGYLEIKILETYKNLVVCEVWYYNSEDVVIRREGPFRLSKGMTATFFKIMFEASFGSIREENGWIGGD
ncbi:MAG: hypothetical protein GY855_13555 [candidate division Zixibacteria bacterium]|nr:hypothetical protein [candidate division Zixibacteria bacterium]